VVPWGTTQKEETLFTDVFNIMTKIIETMTDKKLETGRQKERGGERLRERKREKKREKERIYLFMGQNTIV
jgi:hypothetical protein